jgi:hypothetical protein
METRERTAFVSSYTKILTRAWSDPEFAERLEASPSSAIADAGLSVPSGGKVVIVRSLGGEPDLDAQVKLWEQGKRSGEYRLHVPNAPQVETKELSEADLAAVSGGGNVTACCCCCPCCTCT